MFEGHKKRAEKVRRYFSRKGAVALFAILTSAALLISLVMNHQVLVPLYGQDKSDIQASQLIGEAFPGRQIKGVDCRALIRQHGSLHCATMQLPKGSINTNR